MLAIRDQRLSTMELNLAKGGEKHYSAVPFEKIQLKKVWSQIVLYRNEKNLKSQASCDLLLEIGWWIHMQATKEVLLNYSQLGLDRTFSKKCSQKIQSWPVRLWVFYRMKSTLIPGPIGLKTLQGRGRSPMVLCRPTSWRQTQLPNFPKRYQGKVYFSQEYLNIRKERLDAQLYTDFAADDKAEVIVSDDDDNDVVELFGQKTPKTKRKKIVKAEKKQKPTDFIVLD